MSDSFLFIESSFTTVRRFSGLLAKRFPILWRLTANQGIYCFKHSINKISNHLFKGVDAECERDRENELWWSPTDPVLQYDKGCIKGLEVLAPASSRVDRPLRKKDMFTISMTSSETVQIVSVHNFPEEDDSEEGKDVQRPCLLHVEEDERVNPPLFITVFHCINEK